MFWVIQYNFESKQVCQPVHRQYILHTPYNSSQLPATANTEFILQYISYKTKVQAEQSSPQRTAHRQFSQQERLQGATVAAGDTAH